MTHTSSAGMAGTTSRAKSLGVIGVATDRHRQKERDKQKRPAQAALPNLFGRAGPKQGAKASRKWPMGEVPVETYSGYATHLSLGGHVVLLAADTVLYLDAEPTLGSRQNSEQGAERPPAQIHSLCPSPLALLDCFFCLPPSVSCHLLFELCSADMLLLACLWL
jgi:hypothetical protein